jgi:hypothetical protein
MSGDARRWAAQGEPDEVRRADVSTVNATADSRMTAATPTAAVIVQISEPLRGRRSSTLMSRSK